MDQNLLMDVTRISKKLLITDMYYGLFLSSIEKKENKDIPLAAVGVNKKTLDFTLLINPDSWYKYSDHVKYGVLEHEAKHLCFFHLLTSDLYPNSKMDNVATDLEINQTINKANLPDWGIFIENYKKDYPQLDWKANAGRDHYYKELNKLSKEEQEKLGISPEAQHIWVVCDDQGNETGESLTDSEKEAIRIQLESTIETIAEEVRKSQGHLPAEIEQLISNFKKPKPVFNYKKLIRNFVGNSNKFIIKTSKLKENQRFPDKPKVTIKPMSKILVLIDESGSVSETELFEFLNEIYHLSKNFDIEIRAFDTQVYNPVRYKGNNEFPRTQCGGTSFTAAVDFYNNNPANSCIIFTDGHAEVPPACNKRLLWIISSNGTENSIKNHATWFKMPVEK